MIHKKRLDIFFVESGRDLFLQKKITTYLIPNTDQLIVGLDIPEYHSH